MFTKEPEAPQETYKVGFSIKLPKTMNGMAVPKGATCQMIVTVITSSELKARQIALKSMQEKPQFKITGIDFCRKETSPV